MSYKVYFLINEDGTDSEPQQVFYSFEEARNARRNATQSIVRLRAEAVFEGCDCCGKWRTFNHLRSLKAAIQHVKRVLNEELRVTKDYMGIHGDGPTSWHAGRVQALNSAIKTLETETEVYGEEDD